MDEGEWMKDKKLEGAGSRKKLWSQGDMGPHRAGCFPGKEKIATGKSEHSNVSS